MDAFSSFKPLRNKLKQFSFESILSLSVQKLHELRNFPVQEVAKYPPWFLLLLIKWSVLHSDPGYRRHCFILLYDKLKDHSADSFSPEFGQIFERYIRAGLEYAALSFSDEKQLHRKYLNSLVVDFVVSSESGNVLIESKAIELSPLARVAPDAEVISNALRDSITKAIK